MKVIVPCCDYVCYQENVPRFLTKHNDITLLERVIDSIYNGEEVIVPIYKEHFEILEPNLKDDHRIEFCVLDRRLNSQAETICETIKRVKIQNESIFIKDCDGEFDFGIVENSSGYVCVASLNQFIRINVNNKSYVVVDHNSSILNIREKNVISDLFNVGGYYFANSNEFMRYYETLNSEMPPWNNQIHISDIIGMMILDDKMFEAKQVSNYRDYGTKEDYEINIKIDE